jgi:[ribosomal protein S18]-alanine N-acetyltransferase
MLERAALDVGIVPMRRRHLRSVLRIESSVYPRPWSLGLFNSELSLRGSRSYRVAKVGSAVVGYAGLMHVAGEAHVTTLAVDPQFHRCQVGSRLLLALARTAQSWGCRSMTLEVRMGNTPAQDLYRRFGFAPAGVRKGYYAETGEDALVMWAHDIDTPAYAERLRGIEEGIVGTTVVEP